MLFEIIDKSIETQQIPKLAGVYQFLDENKKTLYVGKARQLRNRVQSYFRTQSQPIKTLALMRAARSIQITVTHNEDEALILENNLIKEHRPRYNILFRDDKSYPYIFLSSHPFPKLGFYRGSQKEKGEYFGPFPNTGAVHKSLRLIQKIFPIRQCEDSVFSNRTRACLQYQIKRCSGPCVGHISAEEYNQDVMHTSAFFRGEEQDITTHLQEQMRQASEMLEFEKAARLRDQIITLRQVQDTQSVEGANTKVNLDVVVLVQQSALSMVYLSFVRHGKYLGGKHIVAKHSEFSNESEILAQFLMQHYNDKPAPQEIITSHLVKNKNAIESVLSRQGSTRIKSQVRSDRARWLKLAQDNAELSMKQMLQEQQGSDDRLDKLTSILKMQERPKRIECFDVSHTQGDFTRASCVVFENARPHTADYRQFKIEGLQKGDDYAAMKQVLERRYARLLKEDAVMPDLIVIDGGKGQVNIAKSVMEEFGLQNILLLGISKGKARKSGDEKFVLAWSNEELDIEPFSPAFHLLQHIRDEAHRFAITGHRKKRQQAMKDSKLEQIPGVGAKTRQKIVAHFGGVKAVENSSVSELKKVSGISKNIAQKIYDFFH